MTIIPPKAFLCDNYLSWFQLPAGLNHNVIYYKSLPFNKEEFSSSIACMFTWNQGT